VFRIGEFSRIAQVSGRLLRYYDKIGLLTPEHTDPESGYRYYTAKQLPRLNRILALKELGLTLDQIARLIDDDISADEIHGMLLMRKAEVEQTLREEMARFKIIESRIEQIDREGALTNYDVVLKSIPAQRFLGVREICGGLPDARELLAEMSRALPSIIGQANLGYFTAIVHSDIYEQEDIDLEMGFLLNTNKDYSYTLSDGRTLEVQELPAVDTMLTVTRVGLSETGHGSYSALGDWVAANGYQFDGLVREVFIKPPLPGHEHETVTEIQYPVAPNEKPPLALDSNL
jgi:DNA-binding transcriptional MerR regulator